MDTTLKDSRVLELRQEGKSFAVIAKQLGYEKPREVWLAFNRALRRHAPEEQASLRKDEMGRLQALTESIQARSDLTEEILAKRLAAVERMRVVLCTK